MAIGISHRRHNEGKRKSWRGLVVDDMAMTRRAMWMALSAMGGQITTASNGAEAIEIVRLTAEKGLDFDIILTDVQMPVMDGLDTVAHLRKDGFTGPIIAISGTEEKNIAERCVAAGCDQFISKSVTFEQLVSLVLGSCHGHIAKGAMAV